MSKVNSKIHASEPKNFFTKPLQADIKELFKAMSQGIIHSSCGKWDELGSDTVEALSSIGLTTEPDELAFLLIQRSITKALFDLAGESVSVRLYPPDKKISPEEIVEKLDWSLLSDDVQIDYQFLDRPANISLVASIQSILNDCLMSLGINDVTAKTISNRFPSYYIYALNHEWRKNSKSYQPLIAAINTPFSRAGDREWAWIAYSSLLKKRVNESVFDEPFSLAQLYIPLNAYYTEEEDGKGILAEKRKRRRVVVSLEYELREWLRKKNSSDLIRVISGGPGSGKSSFARIFAAQLSDESALKVLYIPLHLFDPCKDLIEEVGRFVKDEGVLLQNPLDPESPEPNLLIIFDGLDELTSQGKAASETARNFIHEVEKTVGRRNLNGNQLRILISGREIVVQENNSEFRHPRQILTLLPYFIAPHEFKKRISSDDDIEVYDDPNNILNNDHRQQWWFNYGILKGKDYKGLPEELNRDDLTEITSQPLLNYLVALSLTRNKLDFSKDINLNEIYNDLVCAVYERGYENNRAYTSIKHMSYEDFIRVLEEIGLASWHGDGRTTTVREIEEHCNTSGVGKLLGAFQEGAKRGVTQLLAAFFFRQYGQRPSGDPSFVFTHKSFGEYLTARRIVRAVERVCCESAARLQNPDKGWDEREALTHWAKICGPSPISRYLHIFILNELRLLSHDNQIIYQNQLSRLFSCMLKNGSPMELLQIRTFKETLIQSRNAEESLLVVMNAVARITKQVSMIEHPDPSAFGTWFRRIQGQRVGPESVIAAKCLSFLELSEIFLDMSDLYEADFSFSKMNSLSGLLSNYEGANLRGAHLEGAHLEGANLRGANLGGANLRGANLRGAHLSLANLIGANLIGANLILAHLEGAHLRGTNLERANLRGTNLERANLEGANLERTNLERADLRGVHLEGTNLGGANLTLAHLEGAHLRGTNLEKGNLTGANLKRAHLEGTNLGGANLTLANLERANLTLANLEDIDLRGARIRNAVFPEGFVVKTSVKPSKENSKL